jgi:3-phenylpropionate/trans-cinnamate dioxygenase ferredoxin reductase subunit
MTDCVIIIGAGQAGAQTAISLRQLGFAGRISLLGDELVPPYQRPPLSKKLMTGEMDVERTYIRSEAYYAKSGVDLLLGVRAAAIDRAQRAVRCEDGRALPYDRCVICTGTRARRLDLPGGDLPGVFYLRTLADCERIKAAVATGARAVIIGGGYIGLEIAASLRKWRCEC